MQNYKYNLSQERLCCTVLKVWITDIKQRKCTRGNNPTNTKYILFILGFKSLFVFIFLKILEKLEKTPYVHNMNCTNSDNELLPI